MRTLTVKEYATLKKISPQAVYGLINRGKLEFIVEDGVKLIQVDSKELPAETQVETIGNNYFEDVIKYHKQYVKQLSKQHKRELKDKQKQIDTLQEDIKKLQERYYNLTVMMYQQHQPQIEVIHDTETVKQKKNKNKKKKSKK